MVSDYLLVRVLTDDGIEGVGEATVTARWSGETVWGAQALVDRVLAPLLIGLDPRDADAIDAQMDAAAAHNWFAKSAVEMACWDIAGKSAGQPIYELLGGAKRPLSIRCRFSLGAYDAERAKSRAAELVKMGFSTVKVKVGGEPQRDIARVRAVLEAIGQKTDLVLDANCGWDADTAIDTLKKLEDCDVGLMEQPTPDGDYGAMAKVRRAVKPQILADDICFNLVHARELIRNECCDAISLYPGKNGGINKAKKIVEFSAAHGVACSIGSNLELDIATAAMGHLIVACENVQIEKYPGDVLGPLYHEFSVVKHPLLIEGPITTITDKPGLGVEVDWDVVKANPVE